MTASNTRVRRFGTVDRVTHVFLIVTFMALAVTGAARAYMATDWGHQLMGWLGGYALVTAIHIWSGWLMTVGFVAHIVVALNRIDWRHPWHYLFGPESLVPRWRDFKEFGQRFAWFLGLARAPRFDRWTYLEKFDYWAVFWGVPLLFVTGLMLIYPMQTAQLLPGWTLNVAALLHRAEAILAVAYIVVVHVVFGNFRRDTFPLNDAMFSGSVDTASLEEEKPDWLARLTREGRLAGELVAAPALWFRMLYFLFAYATIALGLYLVVYGIAYSRFVGLH